MLFDKRDNEMHFLHPLLCLSTKHSLLEVSRSVKLSDDISNRK